MILDVFLVHDAVVLDVFLNVVSDVVLLVPNAKGLWRGEVREALDISLFLPYSNQKVFQFIGCWLLVFNFEDFEVLCLHSSNLFTEKLFAT